MIETTEPVVHPANHYLNSPKGIGSWLTTVDHKRIGLMYLAAVAFFFALGGTMALLVRIELMTPELDFLQNFIPFLPDSWDVTGNDLYNKVFTLHGAIMVFLFIIPSIPAALGNFVLPLQIGAKDVAFPRLNLASFYIYLFGAIFAIWSIATNPVDGGWTFYTPYSATSDTAVVAMTLGAFIMGFSSILTGVNFIVTVHKMRAPGMTWNRMPLMIWGLYATAIIQVLATPVLAITLLLLTLESAFGIGIFDPALGGDPVLYQHFFWFYSHPAVYVMILPGMGIISELVTAFSRREIMGYKAVALSSVSIALLSFVVWGHHMFVSGQSRIAAIVFSMLTFLVGIPSGVKVFNWVGTMFRGSISLKTPMLYTLSFLFLFSIGGFTGVMLGVLSADIHYHDTYYVVAHFHYVMMGGTVMALIGGLYYWWPKMFGRMYSEVLGRIGAALVFTGFNLTFFTQFVLGSQGMPRRYATYIAEYQPLHMMSSIGSLVLGAGLIVVLISLVHAMVKGEKVGPNPWGARTLEWTHTTSPPDQHNFHVTPTVTRDPYDFSSELEDHSLDH